MCLCSHEGSLGIFNIHNHVNYKVSISIFTGLLDAPIISTKTRHTLYKMCINSVYIPSMYSSTEKFHHTYDIMIINTTFVRLFTTNLFIVQSFGTDKPILPNTAGKRSYMASILVLFYK